MVLLLDNSKRRVHCVDPCKKQKERSLEGMDRSSPSNLSESTRDSRLALELVPAGRFDP